MDNSKQSMQSAIDRGPTDVNLLDETIGENLRRTVEAHGAREAVVSLSQGIRWTYAEFYERVQALAHGLLGLGLQCGDRVGLWSPNNVEWILLQFATAEIGVILVNINPAYRTHELSYVLNQSECTLLFSAQRFKTSDYVAMAQEVREQCAALKDAIFFGTEAWERLANPTTGIQPEQLEQRRQSLKPDDAINIQYTSGTTGFPKGATLTHRNILNNGYFVTELQNFSAEDRLCVPVPFYHCFGMVMGNLGCTTHGATIVIPSEGFEPTAMLTAIEQERCTAVYGVPTMFIAALGHPEFDTFDLSSLRTGVMAGSPCPVEVMKQCIERMNMTDVTICYGMTETSPVSTQTLPNDSLHHRTATVGRVHPHVEIRIADPDSGETLKRGELGEFCTRGYSIMQGYWNDPQRTADAIDAQGWMHTGDLAIMAEDGYVNIVGRIKDMIIRGGENIYPREIEEFLYIHPDIVEVQVIGVPSERYGEEVMAWIQTRKGSELDEEAVKAFCRNQIAHYKIPRYVKFVESFPMTVTGKIQKYLMRQQSITELNLTVAESVETA